MPSRVAFMILQRIFFLFRQCHRDNILQRGQDRNYLETLATVHQIAVSIASFETSGTLSHWSPSLYSANPENTKSKLTSSTGISPSGFAGWLPHLEISPHKDAARDLLHNVRLGLLPLGLKATAIISPELMKPLSKWLKGEIFSFFLSFFLLLNPALRPPT